MHSRSAGYLQKTHERQQRRLRASALSYLAPDRCSIEKSKSRGGPATSLLADEIGCPPEIPECRVVASYDEIPAQDVCSELPHRLYYRQMLFSSGAIISLCLRVQTAEIASDPPITVLNLTQDCPTACSEASVSRTKSPTSLGCANTGELVKPSFKVSNNS